MTPQERQLIDDLFDRLSKLESAPRDPEATAAISQGLRKAPSAVYALVQTVLVQDEALRQAHDRIEALEAAGAPEQRQAGGFLDSMRDAIFGQDHSQENQRGSVPNVPPRDIAGRDAGNRPVWNSGQVMQRGQYPDSQYNQGQSSQGPYNQGQYNQGQYGQPYGGQQGAPMGGGLMGGALGGGGGGSFLGTAAAAAAGMVGGSLLLNSFRSMMPGGSRQGFGDSSEKGIGGSPWSDQSRGELARDAGVNDVNNSPDLAAQDRAQDLEQDREEDSRSGFFDSASNDDDHDDMDMDSDDNV
jgi:hypothetical protein